METNPQPIVPYLQRPARPPAPVTIAPHMEHGPIYDLTSVLVRRWRVIVGTLVVVVGLVFGYCRMATPWYLGQANILIEPKALQALASQDSIDAQGALTSSKYDYYATQFQLMRSPALVARVIRETGLDKDPRFTRWLSPAALQPGPDGAPSPSMINAYLKLMTVFPIRGTRLVTIQFYATDPKLAAEVANAHARLFVASGLERLYAATEQVRNFMQTKLTELQSRRQDAEVALLKFQAAHNLVPIDLSKDAASDRFMDLNRRLTAAEAERISLQSQYDLVQKHAYDSLPAVIASPLIQRLREEYDQLEIQHALMAEKFRPTYPGLRQLTGQLAHAREQLNAETAKVVASIQAAYETAQANAAQLQQELDTQRSALIGRQDVEGEFLALTRDVETTRALYDSLLQRVKELGITGATDASNITVADRATPPPQPAWPMTKLFLILAVVASLVLGTGLAFLREAWDRTILDSTDLQRAVGLGTLAVVPDYDLPLLGSFSQRMRCRLSRIRRRAFRRAAALGAEPGEAVASGSRGTPFLLGNGYMPPRAEPYRTLRTSLLLANGSTPQAILITSAAGSEGKTTTAVNVAAALARCGASVLLIDADLRLPRCHQALDVAVEPGLSDFLSRKVAAEPIIGTHVDNLSFLPAGSATDNPAELLTGELMSTMLRGLRERFNFIVIDSPPLLAVSDGYLLGSLADGVILVAERGRSRHDRLRLALHRLYQTGAAPLGIVLNRGKVEREYYGYRRTARTASGKKTARRPVPPARAAGAGE